MKIEIMYFGRPSDYLLMTSEKLDIAENASSLEQLLNTLRKRGNGWAHELNECYVVCTINRKLATMLDMIEDGDQIGIYSRKPFFDI